MDPVAMSFYAVVCGVLGVVLPPSLPRLARLFVGAAVGIAAATALPMLRVVLGG